MKIGNSEIDEMRRLGILIFFTLATLACKDDEPAPEVVTITNPQEGETITGTTTISATVESSSPVVTVLFSVDGEFIGEDLNEPYELEWFVFPWADGEEHIISAIAGGVGGTNIQSELLTVTVAEDNITLDASPITNGVVLTWDEKEGAEQYNLFWSESPGVTSANSTKVEDVETPLTIIAGQPVSVIPIEVGKTYYFVVTADFAAGDTRGSNEASGTIN